MFCGKCGKEVPDESRFCPFCAEELEPEQPAAPAPSLEATARLQPQQPPTAVAPPQQPVAPAPPEYTAAPAPAKSSGSGALIAILVVVGLLVLVIGGIGAYVVMKRLGPAPSAQTTADMGGTPTTETPADAGGSSATQASSEAATACLDNLKGLALGALMYAQDHGETLPPAAWVAEVDPYINNTSILRCPSRPDLEVAYAMNEELVGVALSDIVSPAETIMFYETTVAAPNPVGGIDSVPEEGIHDGGIHVAFADGHAQWLPVNQVTQAMFGSASVGETSVTAGAVTSGGGGSPSTWPGLDDLAGVWRVDLAQLDGPPPATLTMVRQGDTVVGTLNDRINTQLELRVSSGDMHFEGTWTDPQVGTAEVQAMIMPEHTLEVLILDGAGGAELLISAQGRRPLN